MKQLLLLSTTILHCHPYGTTQEIGILVPHNQNVYLAQRRDTVHAVYCILQKQST